MVVENDEAGAENAADIKGATLTEIITQICTLHFAKDNSPTKHKTKYEIFSSIRRDPLKLHCSRPRVKRVSCICPRRTHLSTCVGS